MSSQLHAFFFTPPIEYNWFGHIASEVYKDKVYEPILRGKKDLTILDIGANIGLVSYYFSQYAKQVYAIEPSLDHFMVLSKMIEFNDLKNVKPIKKAIYIQDGQFPFGGPVNNTTMRSLHQAVWQEGKPSEMVEAITIDRLFEEEKIEHVDLVKLDVEGTEIEIISSPGFRKVAPKIDVVMGEMHNWSGRHPHQIVDAFKQNGFSYEVIEKLTHSEVFIARRV